MNMTDGDRKARLEQWTKEVERYVTNGQGPTNDFEARSIHALARLSDDCARLETERDAARAQVRALTEAARDCVAYGHNDTCSREIVPGTGCTCGRDKLAAALAASAPAAEPEEKT